ncbi:hypothetical protein [Deinococcus sp. QL22]|uniref:hypothetical protein n=1 Tax=Deinococcus sp. QL22 TaxID=2939437 RepID=UPI002016D69A|nr:hypothetical protein [Deinococcus sp. QL22]UQN06779.1 hypothetical protein M1R55_02325 [Deinococcus sp. QL22]
MTNGTKRSRVIRVAGPGPAIREFLEQQREARAYAEAWYQALRDWDTFRSEEMLTSIGPSRPSRMRVIVGNWRSGSDGGSDIVSTLMQHTPMGAIPASKVALSIKDERGDGLLPRVQAGRGPESLLRETGAWVHPTDRARAYGEAVLELAVKLGDAKAAIHLRRIRAG